jgi:signal peptidase I
MSIIKNILKTNAKPKTQKEKESIWDIIKFILLAILIVLPIRMYIAQPFLVKGISMYPTLKEKDYLIVDEISYHLREPKRGEVIVFRFPGNTKEHFVKRVIGLPGDTIRIINGEVTITTSSGSIINLKDEYVTNHSYESLVDIVVPEDQLFVMGDNRRESYDSRHWRFLPRKLATGRALVRLYPFNAIDFLPGESLPEEQAPATNLLTKEQ